MSALDRLNQLNQTLTVSRPPLEEAIDNSSTKTKTDAKAEKSSKSFFKSLFTNPSAAPSLTVIPADKGSADNTLSANKGSTHTHTHKPLNDHQLLLQTAPPQGLPTRRRSPESTLGIEYKAQDHAEESMPLSSNPMSLDDSGTAIAVSLLRIDARDLDTNSLTGDMEESLPLDMRSFFSIDTSSGPVHSKNPPPIPKNPPPIMMKTIESQELDFSISVKQFEEQKTTFADSKSGVFNRASRTAHAKEALRTAATAIQEAEGLISTYKSSNTQLKLACQELRDGNTSQGEEIQELRSTIEDREETIEELTEECASLKALGATNKTLTDNKIRELSEANLELNGLIELIEKNPDSVIGPYTIELEKRNETIDELEAAALKSGDTIQELQAAALKREETAARDLTIRTVFTAIISAAIPVIGYGAYEAFNFYSQRSQEEPIY